MHCSSYPAKSNGHLLFDVYLRYILIGNIVLYFYRVTIMVQNSNFSFTSIDSKRNLCLIIKIHLCLEFMSETLTLSDFSCQSEYKSCIKIMLNTASINKRKLEDTTQCIRQWFKSPSNTEVEPRHRRHLLPHYLNSSHRRQNMSASWSKLTLCTLEVLPSGSPFTGVIRRELLWLSFFLCMQLNIEVRQQNAAINTGTPATQNMKSV